MNPGAIPVRYRETHSTGSPCVTQAGLTAAMGGTVELRDRDCDGVDTGDPEEAEYGCDRGIESSGATGRVVRAAEGDGLENHCAVTPHQGFESLTLRELGPGTITVPGPFASPGVGRPADPPHSPSLAIFGTSRGRETYLITQECAKPLQRRRLSAVARQRCNRKWRVAAGRAAFPVDSGMWNGAGAARNAARNVGGTYPEQPRDLAR